MATYYVRISGNDSNNGTSPATAWRTIGKALGASGISSGDTVYIGGGATYRETVTVAMTSATAETRIIGDVSGVHTGDAGEVIWSAYTAGDFAVPASSPCVTMTSKNYLTFESITFLNGRTNVGGAIITTTSTNITIRHCRFFYTSFGAFGQTMVSMSSTFGTALNWLVEGCRFFGAGRCLVITAATSASGADYDLNVVVRNCMALHAETLVVITSSGSATYRGNGVRIDNCSGSGVLINASSPSLSSTYPSTVGNCFWFSTFTPFISNVAGLVIDSGGNRIMHIAVGGVYTNVTPNPSSRTSDIPNPYPLELGQSAALGLPFRHPLMPYAASGTFPGGALGFGNVAGGTSSDIIGLSRPSGGSEIHARGTATSGSTSTLVDSTAAWGIDEHVGRLVRVGNQVKRVRINTATTLTTSGGAPAGGLWATAPTNGDAYVIYQGPQVETGKATAGAATTMTDSGAAWATNQWAGYTLEITAGTGSGQTATVTSNTATVLTVPTWGTNPDNTSEYALYWPGGGLDAVQPAAGAFEQGNTARPELTVTDAGVGVRIDGPGAQDLTIPVDATSTTISVRARYDSDHGTGSKPQFTILAQPEIGVSAETVTMTAAADTWETLTLTGFTPTAPGVVTVRLVSRSSKPFGVAFFDTIGVQ